MFSKRTPPLPATVNVVHPIALLAAPTLGVEVCGFVGAGEEIAVSAQQRGFFAATTARGQQGFVPVAVCVPHAIGTATDVPTTEVGQGVRMYQNPIPGDQFTPVPDTILRDWVIFPLESLPLLGRDGVWALVQRQDGRLAYIPTAVCYGLPTNGSTSTAPPDTSILWMFFGSCLFLPNWFALRPILTVLATSLGVARGPVGLGFTLALIALLWLGGVRPRQARPFAAGILLAYLGLLLFNNVMLP